MQKTKVYNRLIELDYSQDYEYVLMSKAKPLLMFSIYRDMVDKAMPILTNIHLAPEVLKDRPNAMDNWLRNRALDLTRSNARLLVKQLNLSNSELEIVLANRGLNITDVYWIKRVDEKIKWSDICLQRRKKMSVEVKRIANMSLRGRLEDVDRVLNPELTNIGSFNKTWKLKKGKWYLAKYGEKKSYYSEMFAQELLKHFGFRYARYKYDNNIIYSKNFTNERMILEHYKSFRFKYENIGLEESVIFENLKNENETLSRDYINMLFVDALINNVDRHEENFGVLKNADTGEVISLAPNYDNNLSFGGPSKPSIGQLRMYLNEFGLTTEQLLIVKSIDLDLLLKIHRKVKNLVKWEGSDKELVEYFTKINDLLDEY